MRLADKVAIVTGGGSGIGRATALRLAKDGAAVVVADKVEDSAASAVAEIKSAGGMAIAKVVDVTSPEQVRGMVQETIAALGKIDILVNNAGWFGIERFLETSEETWDRILDINLKSMLRVSQAVIQHMAERGAGGRIVNISSGAGRAGAGNQASYSAAKGGVIALTKTLARDMARHHINVNVICPGIIDTPLGRVNRGNDPRRAEAMVKLVPWRRMGTGDDVAGVVAFLVSDDADYMTGQTISVDGGMTMY